MSNWPERDKCYSLLETLAEHGIPSPGAARIIDVGTSDYMHFFETEILDGVVKAGHSTCRFYEGPYGAGKTHLLDLIHGKSTERGMITLTVELSHALQLEDWKGIVRCFLEKAEWHNSGRHISIPIILREMSQHVEYRSLIEKLPPMPHTGFRQAMIETIRQPVTNNDKRWPLLESFLKGGKVTVKDFRNAGVQGVREPLSDRNAEHVLSTILQTLYHLGIPGTILLFDENEKALSTTGNIPSEHVRKAANLIRRLIDACVTGKLHGTVVIFSVLNGFLERAGTAYPALGQRIEKPHGSSDDLSWRWPAIPVETVNSAHDDPEQFLSLLIVRLVALAEHIAPGSSLETYVLQSIGSATIESDASSGVRRKLMKVLAAEVLKQIDK